MSLITPLSGLPVTAPSALPSARGASGDFAALLESLSSGLASSEKTAMQGIAGAAPAQEVVAAVMSAERNFQTALAIRDKVVSAFLDMTRMQI